MFIFYLFFILPYGYAFPKHESKIKVTNVYECDGSNNKLKFYDTELNNVDKDGYKEFVSSIEVVSDVTNEWQYQLRVDKMNNGDWQLDIYSREGNLFDEITEYFPKVWKKISDEIQPPFEDADFVKKGKYKLNHLEVLKDEYDLPGVLYGEVRITLKLFDTTGEETFCGVLEAEADN